MHYQLDAVLNDTLQDGHVVGLCSEASHKKICYRSQLPLPNLVLWLRLRKQQPLTQSQCTKGQHLEKTRLCTIIEEIPDYNRM